MPELAQKFRESKPKYSRLTENVRQALVQFLNEKNISSFDVETRVKDEKSFLDKVLRKSYDSPFDEVEDIAGVRVICYYNEDLTVIDEIIKNQFVVTSYSNKSQELDEDQFGYASNHYVVELNKDWLKAPNYRGLEGLKVEIQVRTILMHAWAAISHKLLYKKNEDVPKEFKRKLNRLSALIELADEQFDDIKNMKVEYQNNIVVDEKIIINADNFLAIMRKYFPEREIKDQDIPPILVELREYAGSLSNFEKQIQKCLPVLSDMERDEATEAPEEDLPLWGYAGVARSILDLTNDDYWSKRDMPEPSKSITEAYRKAI
jgi:putative GTP pyrophosphokinase